MTTPREARDERLLFERLVRETRENLLAYALRRSRSAEDAADVVSETYLIASRKLEAVPRDETARLWLFGVAGNVLRRGAQHHRSSEALIARLTSEPSEPADLVQAESGGREDRTIRALRASLASLSARDQEFLTLSAWEGLTPQQIAAVTGLSTNVVRVRLHRARTRLRHRLTQTSATSADARTAFITAKPGS